MVDELSQVISQSTGPAFLLGAVAAFVSALNVRLNRVADHRNALLRVEGDDLNGERLQENRSELTLRAKLLSAAIRNAVVSGICTTCVVIVSFISAGLGFNHAWGAAVLFILALGFFAASLGCLWLEVRTAIKGSHSFL